MARQPSRGEGRRSKPRKRGQAARRSQISLGDALRAFFLLRPEDVPTAEAILALLRLEAEDEMPAPAGVGASMPSSTGTVTKHQQRKKLTRPGDEGVSPPRELSRHPEADASATTTRAVLRRVGQRAATFEAPQWLDRGTDLAAPGEPMDPPPSTALFGRIHRRGLLSSAIGTLEEEGELDVDAIVEILASGRPLVRFPRKLCLTTRRGVQLLIDRGRGMDPFASDQEQIIHALDDVLADDRLNVREFVGCPGRGTAAELDEEYLTWAPPAPGTPILAITDLGIGGPPLDRQRATSGEWLDFAHRVRAEGHLLMALVPYEATRWPPQLARAMTLIHWSEQTGVGEVRRSMRDGRQRLKA